MHSDAPTAAETDWRQILQLYDHLLTIAPSPVVASTELSRLLRWTVRRRARPDRRPESRLLLPVPRDPADRRCIDRRAEARAAYEAAASLTANQSEQAFLRPPEPLRADPSQPATPAPPHNGTWTFSTGDTPTWRS